MLKAYAGMTGNFPSEVLFVGWPAWRGAAIAYLKKCQEIRGLGETVDLRHVPGLICDTPYKRHLA